MTTLYDIYDEYAGRGYEAGYQDGKLDGYYDVVDKIDELLQIHDDFHLVYQLLIFLYKTIEKIGNG